MDKIIAKALPGETFKQQLIADPAAGKAELPDDELVQVSGGIPMRQPHTIQ